MGFLSKRHSAFARGWRVAAGSVVLLATVALGQEIPLEHCDTLPVVRVVAGGHELRFLVDTAATSMLNEKSFAHGEKGEKLRDMRVASWSGTASTRAREVTLENVVIGGAQLSMMRLPAIDLSALGKNCGSAIDGILGVDLLAKLGVTIDLQRSTLHTAVPSGKRSEQTEHDMDRDIIRCLDAFNRSDEQDFTDCLDANIVAFTPGSDIHGRNRVMAYLREHYFHQSPAARLRMRDRAPHAVGEAVWYEYEMTSGSAQAQLQELGVALCRKSNGRWRIASLHHSRVEQTDVISGESQ
jgi:SnoaL-like domain/Aspartyl protease